jgi:hypothetical protein
MSELLEDRVAGVVREIVGPFIMLEYPEKPQHISPFYTDDAVVLRYARTYMSLKESWVVLAAGYSPILMQYPKNRRKERVKKASLKIEVPKITRIGEPSDPFTELARKCLEKVS